MKTILYKTALIIFLITNTLLLAHAQDNSVKTQKNYEASTEESSIQAKHKFIAEIDPLMYFIGGIGGHFGWTPKNNKHFAYGVGFVAGPEISGCL